MGLDPAHIVPPTPASTVGVVLTIKVNASVAELQGAIPAAVKVIV